MTNAATRRAAPCRICGAATRNLAVCAPCQDTSGPSYSAGYIAGQELGPLPPDAGTQYIAGYNAGLDARLSALAIAGSGAACGMDGGV